MMSENALRDLSILPRSEMICENSSKGNFAKPYCDNADKWQRKNSASLVSATSNGGTANPGSEIGVLEVEYIESENLSDVADVDISLKVKFIGPIINYAVFYTG